MTAIKVKDSDLAAAAGKSLEEFLRVFYTAYAKVFEKGYTAEAMASLNSHQHTLYAYMLLLDELNEEGFVGLIQNGYAGYFFGNPVAKALKGFGLTLTSKNLYKAHDIYAENKRELERDKTDEEFIASFEQFEAFDPLEEAITENAEQEMEILAHYVDAHIEEFAEIEK